MNARRLALFAVLVLLTGLFSSANAQGGSNTPGTTGAALGTAITYQGRLMDGGSPVNVMHDFTFTLYNAQSGGAQVGSLVQKEDVQVSDGYFSVLLDFGAGAFGDEARWLEIAVRLGDSTGDYTVLSPRQALTPAPFALYAPAAGSAPWVGLTGVPAGFADNIDNDTLYTAGTGLGLNGTTLSADTTYLQRRVGSTCPAGSSIRSINSDGTVTCETDDNTTYLAGTGIILSGGQFSVNFAGTGSAVTASRSDHHHDPSYVNEGQASSITSAMVADGTLLFADLNGNGCSNGQIIKWNGSAWVCAADATGGTSFWSLTGNAGTTPGVNYLGTSDNTALVLKVNNSRALRIEPSTEAPNLIGGWWENYVTAGVRGATIAGGGSGELGENRVMDDFGTVAGGAFNQVGNGSGTASDANYATVGGGYQNTAGSEGATVSGGAGNVASGYAATVGGGGWNQASGWQSVIAGGQANTVSGGYSVAGGGIANVITGNYSTVAGGRYNSISGYYATIGGGGPSDLNNPSSTANQVFDNYGVIGGGGGNRTGSDDGDLESATAGTVAGGYMNTASGQNAVVGGGWQSFATATSSTVAGGQFNQAAADYTAVCGGYANQAAGYSTAVGGGYTNVALGNYAAIPGGLENFASGQYATIGGGAYNTASGEGSTIAGGGGYYDFGSGIEPITNTVTSMLGTIGGGGYNQVTGFAATVGGGWTNLAGNDGATVAGGMVNRATASYATVGGGSVNKASASTATVAGGSDNTAAGLYATVSGGAVNTASGESSVIGGGYVNTASGDVATLSGGWNNTADGWYSVVGGGAKNTAASTGATISGGGVVSFDGGATISFFGNDASGSASTIGGGFDNTTAPSATYAVIAGGASNTANAEAASIGGGYFNEAREYGTVGGGSHNTAYDQAVVGGGMNNHALAAYATIGGGGPTVIAQADTTNNEVYDQYGTIGGGGGNQAGSNDGNTTTSQFATVGGGRINHATGPTSTVGGGWVNTASGNAATVPGGANNVAGGGYSFAAGAEANASHAGSFVWSSGEATSSWGNNTFTVRAHGGVRFYTASGTAIYGYVASDGSWHYTSDQRTKENFSAVDQVKLLETLQNLPVENWNFKQQEDSNRHIGPTAQDFNTTFASLLGEVSDPATISSSDAIGISLAAIQGLYRLNQDQAERIKSLEQQLNASNGKPFTSRDPLPAGWMALVGFLAILVVAQAGMFFTLRRRIGGQP